MTGYSSIAFTVIYNWGLDEVVFLLVVGVGV